MCVCVSACLCLCICMNVCVYVCVYVCMCYEVVAVSVHDFLRHGLGGGGGGRGIVEQRNGGGGERERETDRQRHRETERRVSTEKDLSERPPVWRESDSRWFVACKAQWVSKNP